jgi:two-component system, NarL family, sensor kinase
MGQSQPAGQALVMDVKARHFALASPLTATVLGAVLLVLLIAGWTLSALDHQLTIVNVGSGLVVALTYTGVGVVVARHQSRNPVGWILILIALLTMLTVDGGLYAFFCYRLGHPGLPLASAAVLLGSLWLPAYASVALVILLFPDGRLTSRRWRLVLWAYIALVAGVMIVVTAPAVAAVASHDIHVDAAGNVTNSRHLAGWLAHPPTWLMAVIFLSIGAIWLSFAAHQVLRWQRATGERRQQLKWLASGAAVALGLGLIGSLATTGIVQRVLEIGLLALPVCIGVGILKYRLYEITGSSAAPWRMRS